MAPGVCPSTYTLDPDTNWEFLTLLQIKAMGLKLFPGSIFAYDQIDLKYIHKVLKIVKA